jgi:hypothetical protein
LGRLVTGITNGGREKPACAVRQKGSQRLCGAQTHDADNRDR